MWIAPAKLSVSWLPARSGMRTSLFGPFHIASCWLCCCCCWCCWKQSSEIYLLGSRLGTVNYGFLITAKFFTVKFLINWEEILLSLTNGWPFWMKAQISHWNHVTNKSTRQYFPGCLCIKRPQVVYGKSGKFYLTLEFLALNWRRCFQRSNRASFSIDDVRVDLTTLKNGFTGVNSRRPENIFTAKCGFFVLTLSFPGNGRDCKVALEFCSSSPLVRSELWRSIILERSFAR